MRPGHLKRILTALALLCLVAAALILGGWFMFGLAFVVSCLGLMEFFALFSSDSPGPGLKAAAVILGGLILLSAQFGILWGGVLILALAHWGANLGFLFSYGRTPDRADYAKTQLLTAGLCYIPLMLQFVIRMERFEIILVLAAVMASDTGAYYCGSKFGRRPVWPSVSPKKTVEGAIGGTLLSMAVCAVLGAFQGPAGPIGLPVWGFALLGLGLSLAAQFGDFFESALKRKLGVKDSGKTLPGHGGILDRIDGLLLAVPVYIAVRTVYSLF